MTIFTKIINGEISCYKVAEDDNYFAFLDINPVGKGHTLVVPRKEVDYIYDLDEQTLAGLWLFTKKVAKAIEAVVPCNRIGITVIGLEVPHAHVHLIPINTLADMNFSKERAKFSAEEFTQLAEAIASNVR